MVQLKSEKRLNTHVNDIRPLPRAYAKNKDFLRDLKFPYLWGLKKISFYKRLIANRDKTLVVQGRNMFYTSTYT